MGKGGKKKNKFDNKNIGGDPRKDSHRVWRAGDRLAVLPPRPGGVGLEHNYFPWLREWGIRIGQYGERYKQAFDDGGITPYDLDAEMAKHPLRAELSLSDKAFQLTEAQIQTIELMIANGTSQPRIDTFKARCFEEWLNDRAEINLEIKRDNIVSDKMIAECVKIEREDKDTSILIYSDILYSMTENSQRLVKAYRVAAVSGGDAGDSISSYAESTAEADRNWMFLFRAAQDTHVKKVAGIHDVDQRDRISEELKSLENMYHEKGSYTRWSERFEDQLKVLESLGATIIDVDKRRYFMNNLNKEIFVKARSDWSNPRRRGDFPTTFDELFTYISAEYITISQQSIETVLRVERYWKDESTFAGKESKSGKGKSSPPKSVCEICGGNHNTNDCKYRNDKFSVESNKGFYLREIKRKTEEGKSDSTKSNKGTKVDPPKTETTKRVVELSYSDTDIISRTITDSVAEELTYRAKEILPEELVFIYDTASTSGALVPGYEGAVTDTYTERTQIVGQGGGAQFSDVAGINTFGRFRQLKTSVNNQNLISHAQAERNWRINHVRPGYLRLEEWPWNKCKTGKVWHLYSDEKTWGDPFPRLVITRDELPDLLKSGSNIEGCLTFYEPNLPPAESLLSADEIKSLDKVDAIHLRTSHTSGPALLRMIQSESASDPHSLLGISAAEVELWVKYRGSNCSGCIQGKMKDHSRVKSTASRSFSIGEAIGGDLIFIETRFGKSPSAVLVDMNSGYVFLSHLRSKSSEDLGWT